MLWAIDTLSGATYNYTYEEGRLIRATHWENEHLTASVTYVYHDDGSMKEKRIRTSCGADRVVCYGEGENENNSDQYRCWLFVSGRS